MLPTTRRPREIDTSMHFYPHATCDNRSWVGLGNLHTNGHLMVAHGSSSIAPPATATFWKHMVTILYSNRIAVDLILRVLACLAESLGIRATTFRVISIFHRI